MQQKYEIPIKNSYLNFLLKMFCAKVLLNERNEAEGVEYDRHGERRVAFARKEVISS